MGNTDLRQAVRGQVWLPGEAGFDDETKAWNTTVAQPVAAVVEIADADDAATLVDFARQAGIGLAVQPRGHGASGNVDGLILVRTKRLDSVEVDPDRRSVRVGAGSNWGRVLEEAGKHGLTGLAGSAPGVSVAGFSLGGGLSWFSRKYGRAADSVTALEIVDADGNQSRVTAESDPDLFWALRGGGGDFALVTALEFRLYAEPNLYGGRITWPVQQAAEVFAAFRELTSDAPHELSVWFTRIQVPQVPPMAILDVAYLGERHEAEHLLAGLGKIDGVMSDKRDLMPTAALGDITAEPTGPSPIMSRTEILTGLDDAVAEYLVSAPTEPLAGIQVRHLGGELGRAGSDTGAGAKQSGPYLMTLLGFAFNPQLAPAIAGKQAEIVAAVEDAVSGRKPYTFLGRGDTAAQAFPADALTRLRELKRTRDPENVFRANFPVLAEPE
ncbi:MAG TPA: FAD-binding oxidoreductase [Kribbella sp.]|uniref:FAD-binding oxidoreductase n=1 Tax=Kribbella sp. TaxID=1871183 RepID=UPI002D76C26A|nr:FAD-binding oxidoreductase [Kribbella sp.]HET6298311.1 FAD-binding oxidoreductase [Kribbella sp.]